MVEAQKARMALNIPKFALFSPPKHFFVGVFPSFCPDQAVKSRRLLHFDEKTQKEAADEIEEVQKVGKTRI